ncbi:hypothetical protein NPIL_661331 [Nephila pilipes]|uniref:Uncharacterized protein n=1 Tax=Nephila pilipes TaxID=299642 RepID=A0A8X6MJG8_NEPPI|nr:hypothetical protein NPIL_661331 [Nephila pilipes]
MNSKHFFKSIEQLWTEVMKNVKDAVVFMDDAAAECLHWHGGLKRILDSGAIFVDNFSPFVVQLDFSHVKNFIKIL